MMSTSVSNPKKPGEVPSPGKNPENDTHPEPEPAVWPKKEPEIQPARELVTMPPTAPPEIRKLYITFKHFEITKWREGINIKEKISFG